MVCRPKPTWPPRNPLGASTAADDDIDVDDDVSSYGDGESGSGSGSVVSDDSDKTLGRLAREGKTGSGMLMVSDVPSVDTIAED
jgi:hypothetical protein